MLVNASSPESEWQKNIEAYQKKADDEAISYSVRNQRMRSQETKSYKKTFVNSFFKPYLEALKRNLKARFPSEDIKFLPSYQLFDPTVTLSSDKLHTLLNVAAKQLASTTLEHESEVFSAVRSQYLIFGSTIGQKGFENTSDVMKDVSAQLLPGHTTVFPLLANLASCLLVIPASTADCERGFSALK
uniref:HAT C-terminal dimerisation domain-containing protein n=1 Tax=Amphimedon queenslandica TaxID=400682 RepID=A0A1X7SH54_AMPQE